MCVCMCEVGPGGGCQRGDIPTLPNARLLWEEKKEGGSSSSASEWA